MIFSRSGPVLLLRPCGTSGSLSLSLWAAHPPALSFSGLPPCGPVPLRVTLSALVAQWPTLCFYVFVFVCIWLCIFLWACTTPTVWASSTPGHTLGTCCTWGQWQSFEGSCVTQVVSLYLPFSVSLSCMYHRLPAGKFHPGSQYQHLLHHYFNSWGLEPGICLWVCTTRKVVVWLSDGQSETLTVLHRGEGVSQEPQKWIRNLYTTPNWQW